MANAYDQRAYFSYRLHKIQPCYRPPFFADAELFLLVLYAGCGRFRQRLVRRLRRWRRGLGLPPLRRLLRSSRSSEFHLQLIMTDPNDIVGIVKELEEEQQRVLPQEAHKLASLDYLCR